MNLYRHADGGFLADQNDGTSIAIGFCGGATLIDLVKTPDLEAFTAITNDDLIADQAPAMAAIQVIQGTNYNAAQKYWAKVLYTEFGARIPNLPPLS